jgi:hypothetical protein
MDKRADWKLPLCKSMSVKSSVSERLWFEEGKE